MFNNELIQLFLNLIFGSIESCQFDLLTLHYFFNLQNTLLEDFLFRLDILGLLILFFYKLYLLFPELYLQMPNSFLIFRLHIADYALLHDDHLVERILDSISFSLQILYLVEEVLILRLQFPAFAGLLLNFLQIVCLSVKNMIG